jgi:hypothetical protein
MKKIVGLVFCVICIMQFSFAQKNALEAAFEQVGMDIVYAGIPMEFQAGGGGAGYDNVKASPSVVVATASQVGQ